MPLLRDRIDIAAIKFARLFRQSVRLEEILADDTRGLGRVDCFRVSATTMGLILDQQGTGWREALQTVLRRQKVVACHVDFGASG